MGKYNLNHNIIVLLIQESLHHSFSHWCMFSLILSTASNVYLQETECENILNIASNMSVDGYVVLPIYPQVHVMFCNVLNRMQPANCKLLKLGVDVCTAGDDEYGRSIQVVYMKYLSDERFHDLVNDLSVFIG